MKQLFHSKKEWIDTRNKGSREYMKKVLFKVQYTFAIVRRISFTFWNMKIESEKALFNYIKTMDNWILELHKVMWLSLIVMVFDARTSHAAKPVRILAFAEGWTIAPKY